MNEPAFSLLSNCTSGGCGAKIEPGALAALLAGFPVKDDPNLLAGFQGNEDAALYRLDGGGVLVSTVDFFPPMVDDPHLFGRIAAANALSDVYAMGGRPLYCLNLVCFPEKLDKKILADILRGGAEKVIEAGAVIAGGHSIYDHETKYGLAVTGIVNTKNGRAFYRNSGCLTGDAVILTKPLGAGLIMSALRAGEAAAEHTRAAFASMERLNRYAAEKLSPFPVHACTDVTGFGLAGHAAEMAGGDHGIVIESSALPLLPGAFCYAENFFAAAAGQRNRTSLSDKVDVANVPAAMQEICFDPQTSGGLLIAVAMEHAQQLCDAIRADDPDAAIIGEVTARDPERDRYAVTVL